MTNHRLAATEYADHATNGTPEFGWNRTEVNITARLAFEAGARFATSAVHGDETSNCVECPECGGWIQHGDGCSAEFTHGRGCPRPLREVSGIYADLFPEGMTASEILGR